jgi:hypothetical protein
MTTVIMIAPVAVIVLIAAVIGARSIVAKWREPMGICDVSPEPHSYQPGECSNWRPR